MSKIEEAANSGMARGFRKVKEMSKRVRGMLMSNHCQLIRIS